MGDVTSLFLAMYGQVWDSVLPVIAEAHQDGASPMPPRPWAEQTLETQLTFMTEMSATMLGVANTVIRVGSDA